MSAGYCYKHGPYQQSSGLESCPGCAQLIAAIAANGQQQSSGSTPDYVHTILNAIELIGIRLKRIELEMETENKSPDSAQVTKEQLAAAYDKTFMGRSRGSENPRSSFHILWGNLMEAVANAAKEPG